jgi:hypothetical protein
MGNQLVSSFRPVLDNETTLRQLSDVRLGDDSKTLREHVNSESEYSAEIFAGLSSADLVSMGVEDANKDGFIGDNPNTKDKVETGDFVGSNVAVSNFKKVRSATFDKTNSNYDGGSHLKKLTEKHIYRVGEIMHSVGNKLYTPPSNNNNNNNNLGKSYIDSAKSYVSYEDQDKKVNQAKAGQTLYDWQGFKYTTTDGGKTYTDPSGLNEPTADVLSGTRFGLSNRLSGITFGGGGAGGGAYDPSDLAKLGGSETDDKTLVKKFKDKYPGFKFNATSFDFGDKVEVTHKESGTTIKIPVSPTFYDDLANFMNNPTKKKLK